MPRAKKIKKYFLITIDSDGDNQWLSGESEVINIGFLSRFQELAEKYGLKPTWLIDYEIVQSKKFIKYFCKKQKENLCEIGMFMQACNTPPFYSLTARTNAKPYITEYPKKIMNEKVKTMTDLITKNFNQKPVSHRSGRWVINATYLDVLNNNGYKVDCSVIPLMNYESSLGKTGQKGNDFTSYPTTPYFIRNGILEVPMSVKKLHHFKKIHNPKDLIKSVKRYLTGCSYALKPDKSLDLNSLIKVIDLCDKNEEYLMLTLNSCDLIPNGGPNFRTEESIEKLYELLESIFKEIKRRKYVGATLKEFSEVGLKFNDKNM